MCFERTRAMRCRALKMRMTPESDWFMPDWPLFPAVMAVTTTRTGGASTGPYQGFNLADHVGDSAVAVSTNRERLRQVTGLAAIQWLQQVHGIEVLAADSTSAVTVPEADAAWTVEPGLGLAVLTADCLPVVIAAADASAVAVAHAGWRGLLDGVLERVCGQLPATDAGYLAWIGPAISAAAYEVGEDVAERVREFAGWLQVDSAEVDAVWLRSGRQAGKYQLDLAAVAGEQLQQLGVTEVCYSGVCSAASAQTYSYRRDGITGRMATLVWLPDVPAGSG